MPAHSSPSFSETQPLQPGVTLLEASAGTGKTYSITSLVLRFVVEYKMPIEQVLIVTFTNAATAELSARIRMRLGEALVMLRDGLNRTPQEDPVELDPLYQSLLQRTRVRIQTGLEPQSEALELLRTAIENFDRAHISTIHSFCQRMLQQHALEAKAPFGVKLIERNQDIIDNLVQDYWTQLLASQSPMELQLLKLAGISPKVLRQLGRLAIEQRHARIVPQRDDYADAHADQLLGKVVQSTKLATTYGIQESLEALDHIPALQRNIPDIRKAFEDISENKVGKNQIQALKALTYRYAGAANTPLIQAARELYSAFSDWEKNQNHWALARRAHFVETIRERYTQHCEKTNVWDFNDLLLKLAGALNVQAEDGSYPLADKIRKNFQAILIDEFQDTDPIQWSIFSRLFRQQTPSRAPDKYLFLIGDPKQAIYAFRGADINTYLEAASQADQRYTLDTNYRSDDIVIEVVNALYRQGRPALLAMSETNKAFAEPRELPLTPSERSIFGRPEIQYIHIKAKQPSRLRGNGPPLRLIWIKRKPSNSDLKKDIQTLRYDWIKARLPELVADDIVRTLQSNAEIQDEHGHWRSVTPSDMAVLVNTNKQAELQQEALRARGVPAVIYGARSIYETEEARELSKVLLAILDPSKSTTVNKALITRLLGVTAQELAEYSISGGAVLEDWVNRLYTWRNTWTKHSFIQAFRELLNSRSETLLSQQGGERRVANFIQLSELLHLQATERGLKAPALAEWLRRQVKRASEGGDTALESEERLQVRLETDEPAVEIVTIHKSKGLEYPLLWAPSLFDSTIYAKKDPFLFRDEAGPVIDLRPDNSRYISLSHAEPGSRNANRANAELSEQLESMRVLYVALTRAKHQLTIYGGMGPNVHKASLSYLLHLEQPPFLATMEELEQTQEWLKALPKYPDERFQHAFQQGWPEPAASFEFAPSLKPLATRSQYIPPARPQDELKAASWSDRPIDTEWRRTSFSGLASELHGSDTSHREPEQDQSAADEDTLELPPREPLTLLPEPEEANVRLAELPAGRMVGNFIHKVFELHDFQDLNYDTIAALIERELKHFGLSPDLVAPFSLAFKEILQTPLDRDGFTLSQLPLSRRLAELDFVFPIRERGFNHSELFQVFEKYGSPEVQQWLNQHYGGGRGFTVRGFMSGSIDLVFQNPRDKRWYLLDWKSNRIGLKPSQYNRASMAAVMGHHHYFLQYHLYTVALVRYLKARLGDAFDYERDFGGIYYLFLRGIHPDYPLGTGVFSDRPSLRLVQELDRCLGAQANSAGVS